MSIHSSLHGADSLVGERSVLSRLERIEQLQKEDRFDPESDSIFGLPKVRTKFRIKKKKLGDDEEGADLYKGVFSLAYGSLTLLNNTKLSLKRNKFYGLLGANNCGNLS